MKRPLPHANTLAVQTGSGDSAIAMASAAAPAPPPVRIEVAPPVPDTETDTDTEPVDRSAGFEESWDDIRADGDIQFEPLVMPESPPPQPPGWFERFFEWLGELLAPIGEALGFSWPVLKWVLLGIAILILLYLLWRLVEPALDWRPNTSREVEPEWVPNREEAIALLEDADRLAESGDYDAATHLLLQRSVKQISDARPDWVEPSSTARELAALGALPDVARSAFATIAERVEKSLFALRRLGQDDWQAARDAYSRFALERF